MKNALNSGLFRLELHLQFDGPRENHVTELIDYIAVIRLLDIVSCDRSVPSKEL